MTPTLTPACPVCRDTGTVWSPDPDGESVYEQACPERVHDGQPCLICGGKGWTASPGCNCGTPLWSLSSHEPYCGMEPCPRGCPFVSPAPAYLDPDAERIAAEDRKD